MYVGLVSRDWRCAINSTPVLWSCATVDNYTDLQKLCAGLSKSGVLPLHLRFDLVARNLLDPSMASPSQIHSFLHRAFTSLRPYLYRCTCLDLCTLDGTTTVALLSVVAPLSFPTLSNLQLDLAHTSRVTAHTALAFALPALARLVINGGFLELRSSVYSSLTTLVLRGQLYTQWSHFVTSLTGLVRLQKLEFHDVACFGPSSYEKVSQLPTLLLPQVRNFKLSASFVSSTWILSILSFPGLRRLQLVLPDLLTLGGLVKVVGRAFRPVRHLELSMMSCSADGLVSLLAPMTSLLTLDASSSHHCLGPQLLLAVRDPRSLLPECATIRLPYPTPTSDQHLLSLVDPDPHCRTWFASLSSSLFIRVDTHPLVKLSYSSYDASLGHFC
ncbi:hypothetical protein B0H16DRAFT_1728907 [Mycena metata]|uniref:Uncharacterized protein n=1 Tax=Mycena metata TaxID=1033252 RepID=A0AAD7IDF7_9AGAR|nr:hypothetical protein B0H16DRAFT_1728907 [Mycena metata]